MNFPKVGEILPNGHTVDAAYCVGDARYVLAHRDGAHEQFVVWSVDQDGDTVNGRYFDNPVAAQKKFAERCFDWWADLMTEHPRIDSEDQQAILESTMDQLRPALQKALKYGIPDAVSVRDPGKESFKNADAPEPKSELRQKTDEREDTIDAVIRLIIERMEEKGKGHLTARYVIGILQDTSKRIESASLMRPAKDCLTGASCTRAIEPMDFLQYGPAERKALRKALECMNKYSK